MLSFIRRMGLVATVVVALVAAANTWAAPIALQGSTGAVEQAPVVQQLKP